MTAEQQQWWAGAVGAAAIQCETQAPAFIEISVLCRHALDGDDLLARSRGRMFEPDVYVPHCNLQVIHDLLAQPGEVASILFRRQSSGTPDLIVARKIL